MLLHPCMSNPILEFQQPLDRYMKNFLRTQTFYLQGSDERHWWSPQPCGGKKSWDGGENPCSNQPKLKDVSIHLFFFHFPITHLRTISSRRARTGSLGGRRCEQRSLADKSSSSRECSKRRNTSTPGKEAILAGMFPVGTSSTISLLCSHSLVCPSSVSYIFVFFSLACLCFSSSFLLASMKYAFPPGFWRCQSNR